MKEYRKIVVKVSGRIEENHRKDDNLFSVFSAVVSADNLVQSKKLNRNMTLQLGRVFDMIETVEVEGLDEGSRKTRLATISNNQTEYVANLIVTKGTARIEPSTCKDEKTTGNDLLAVLTEVLGNLGLVEKTQKSSKKLREELAEKDAQIAALKAALATQNK